MVPFHRAQHENNFAFIPTIRQMLQKKTPFTRCVAPNNNLLNNRFSSHLRNTRANTRTFTLTTNRMCNEQQLTSFKFKWIRKERIAKTKTRKIDKTLGSTLTYAKYAFVKNRKSFNLVEIGRQK